VKEEGKKKDMAETQTAPATSRKDITTLSLIARVIIGGGVSAVILIAFSFLLAGKSSTPFSLQSIPIRIVSGIFYVTIMTPLARRVWYRRLPRFLAIFVPLYITGSVTDLIEAYFYSSVLTPLSLIAALIINALPLLLITGVITWLIPADEDARNAPGFSQTMRERSFFSWFWRIVVAGVPYPAIYLSFAAIVTPLEHVFYHDPAFIASLHTVVPSTMTTIILEAIRGILFVLAMLPVIAAIRTSRWVTGLYIAVIGAMLEAWIPLLAQTSWPVMMRVGNLLELTADACGRALLMALLVALPALQARKISSSPDRTQDAPMMYPEEA